MQDDFDEGMELPEEELTGESSAPDTAGAEPEMEAEAGPAVEPPSGRGSRGGRIGGAAPREGRGAPSRPARRPKGAAPKKTVRAKKGRRRIAAKAARRKARKTARRAGRKRGRR
jgi:hypothetical protein